ncbi:MAG: Inner membrane protein YtfF [Luteibacter sp.]|uniref:DMT family transporter n=1 Tax=Luteibacter sp. TaxID=1886636 RepID=UPI00137E5179|nr:DMT family transporter [Luteibacter sp.]KAF1005166.1 MAG: Inner membrane protein YtfF [Luteibacter sp.]
MAVTTKTWLGIGCGVLAGALWGSVFVAPELVGNFSPLQLAAGRYLVYGAISAILLLPRLPLLGPWLTASHWRTLAMLGLLGNVIYYVALAAAVQWGGVAVTSLVIGFLPVCLTLVGSRDHGAVPLRRLAPSLLLSLVAIGCIAWQSFAASGTERPAFERIGGLLCAVIALISWTIYAIRNARWLARLEHVSVHDWNLLTGVATGAMSLLLVPAALWFDAHAHDTSAWLRFAAVSTGVAVFASIVGNGLWNLMSRLLPLTLVGQMILFETLFALLYGFLWESRWPHPAEWIAMAAVSLSVVLCVRVHAEST